MGLSTAECMAVAVLKGDATAARALADLLTETEFAGGYRMPPVFKLDAAGGDVKGVLYANDAVTVNGDIMFDVAQLDADFRGWLDTGGTQVLMLTGIERLELYQMPKGV